MSELEAVRSTLTKNRWQSELIDSITSASELLELGLITPLEHQRVHALEDRFRIRLPRSYAALIDRANLATCPIRKQSVPSIGEEDPSLPLWAVRWSREVFGRNTPWTDDAIGDVEKLAAPRLTHRYGNRAILHLSSLCAMYCRFCFRKTHLNDSDRTLYEGTLDPAIRYLSEHEEIRELILTGGDPLSLTDLALERLLDRLHDEAPSLRIVRIHSKMPATLPTRLTGELLDALSKVRRFETLLVTHFNHPKELTSDARTCLEQARRRGIRLYNQSVLLAGVNDSESVLNELFQCLYELGVTPFYLHHADWTPGTFDFRVSVERGRRLMQSLAGKLSGPAMPDYVLDMPGGLGKVSLMDTMRVRILESHSDHENRITGSIYLVHPSNTRDNDTQPVKYLDLSRI